MITDPKKIKSELERSMPDVSLALQETGLMVSPEDLLCVCQFLKNSSRFSMDYLSSVTAVDYPPEGMEIVYQLYSMSHESGPIVLRVRLGRTSPKLDSVTPVWRSAELQEREIYDLYGVYFENHPDLRRIFMWDGFKGHPMRKDYVPEDQNRI